MIKCYSFFAKWRKKDIEFLNSLGLNKIIKENYDGFWVEEDDRYKKIIQYYSKKELFFNKVKPKEFRVSFSRCKFSKEDLDNAKYYALGGIHQEINGFPEPQNEQAYKDVVFKFENKEYRINKTQIAPFRVKKPKWKKGKVSFSLEWEFEFVFFKKEFFQEVLAPLGLQSMEVLNKKGETFEDTVQLVIPLAKSKLLLENSAYDIHPLSEIGGYKQYALQTLDFFPLFEKEFDFHICYSQEEFLGGHRKIIISKEFCELLVRHKIVKYVSGHLTPMKNR